MQSVKVVITGPFDAGKTTFIKSVSEITVLSTERQVTSAESSESGETTVAMDFGRITISDDVVLYLFGTPGQERFSFMWETLAEGMLGFVVMVDGTSDDSIREAISMIEFFTRMSDVPFVVAANRVDKDDAAGLERIRSTLALPPDVTLLGCDARDRESVKSVLLGLLFRILQTLE
jgi:hypothetical protein